jgi:hypothetical protein|tara:strand:- start:12147 stop:12350 length:204 start_codon:yes stop_codon:yes gene_type:complete
MASKKELETKLAETQEKLEAALVAVGEPPLSAEIKKELETLGAEVHRLHADQLQRRLIALGKKLKGR